MSEHNTDIGEILKKYGFDMYTAAAPAKDAAENDSALRPPFMPKDPALAMAYVPMQPCGQLYEPEKGLKAGTIFQNLDKPFYGRWND